MVKILKKNTEAYYLNWPIYECWMSTKSAFKKQGIGHVVITRKSPKNNKLIMGIYLVDVFCLGIKNCFLRSVYLDEYEDMLETINISDEIERADPAEANTLIQQAVEYAKKLGFKPHRDFKKAKIILHNLPISKAKKFNFGKNGRPLYIQGPNESEFEVYKILHILDSNVGAGNYDFAVIDETDN